MIGSHEAPPGSSGPPVLSVTRISESVRVLGPGLRAVVWVQGCPLRCAGCLSPEGLPFEGGESWDVDALAMRLNSLGAEVTGVTFSGGEPMAQARALAALVDRLRAQRDWSVMSYSGFTLERLGRGDPDQREFLARLDILVDGPFLSERHRPLLWRGSDNQRIHCLTSRHQLPDHDASAGVEAQIGPGSVLWNGVPPVPGFRENFERALDRDGIHLTISRRTDVR
ncbi:4Fe-4S single cluster domain-containing protein [Streptomyces sp. NBC_00829]|uniref:4Fe-4S single cluster domain-containing protein n=1 Tax=Streptomyces sp. NBC_00829 TaxID=2903679 RepID=UPI003863D8F8|nr:radical SAM protein [Streptomyces sp. NBC_00829]